MTAPLPPGIQTVTVAGTILGGRARITALPAELIHAATGTLITREHLTRTVGPGDFTVELIPGDHPGVNPAGWTWWVEELYVGGRNYSISIPFGSPPLAFADLVPVPSSAGKPTVVGPRGLPGIPGELTPGQIEQIADDTAAQALADLEPPVDLNVLFENALA